MQIFDRAQKRVVQTECSSVQHLGGCHLHQDRFAIVTRNKLLFWRIRQSADTCKLEQYYEHGATLLTAESPAVCVRLSAANEYCAIGFQDGLIQLFRQHPERPKLVHELRSHTTQVHSLIFSPWTSDNRQPVILASLAAELCFWNITFAVNNPSVEDQAPARLSARYADRPSPSGPAEYSFINDAPSPWTGKLGPTGKQVMLSCFKFIGNAAQCLFPNAEFTRFLTIDDVGEIYYLRVRQTKVDQLQNSFDTLGLETIDSLIVTEVTDSDDDIFDGPSTSMGGDTVLKLRPVNGQGS